MINKLTIKFISIVMISGFLLPNFAQAKTDYNVEILGKVTLRIDKIKAQNYETGNTFSINEGSTICFDSGKGYVVIEGNNTTISLSHKNKGCKTLPKMALNGRGFKIPGFQHQGEESVSGSSRGGNDLFIYPDSQGLIKIKYNKYKTRGLNLPVILQFISPEGKVVEQFESNRKNYTSFVLPKSFLIDKQGYTLKVSDKDQVLLKKIFSLIKPELKK